jgi:hypothetical protein
MGVLYRIEDAREARRRTLDAAVKAAPQPYSECPFFSATPVATAFVWPEPQPLTLSNFLQARLAIYTRLGWRHLRVVA